jgi:hypothetical protein
VERAVGLEFPALKEAAEERLAARARISEDEAVVFQLGTGAQAEESVLEGLPRADAVSDRVIPQKKRLANPEPRIKFSPGFSV